MSPNLQLQHEFYDRLIESQYADPAERLRASRKQLAKLVQHARASVPFYANRLDVLFDSNGQIDWERWSEVPIVTRNDLLTRPMDLRATSLPGFHRGPVQEESTSGSTGLPVTVASSLYSGNVHTAAVYRAHTWHELDWSQDLLLWQGDNPRSGHLPDGIVAPPWGPGWIPPSGKTIILNRFVSAEDVARFLSSRGIRYLSARPRSAQAVAVEAVRLGIKVELDAILTFGTAISPDAREDCLRAFGAKMVGAYSSKEGQLMAYQCSAGHHFHVNEETTLLEVMDDEGRPSSIGQTGRVVVTPLYNFAQPLIRYEHGDLAVPGTPCLCGRTLAVVERIAGRTTHLFRFPDGRVMAPNLPYETMQPMMGSRYWQVAQVSPLRLEIRYLPLTGHDIDRSAVASLIRAFIHPAVEIDFRPSLDLTRSDGGKFLDYVYEINKASDTEHP